MKLENYHLETTSQESSLEERGFWGDGRVGSTRNLSSYLNCSAESVHCNCSETLESVEGLQLPGKSLGDTLWLILVNFSS